MTDMPLTGYAAVHRTWFSLLRKKPVAAVIFEWIFAMAAPLPRVDESLGKPVKLKRGEVLITYPELSAAIPLFSVKQVRTAFAWLVQEKMIEAKQIRMGERNGQIVTVVNYGRYQKNGKTAAAPAAAPDPTEGKGIFFGENSGGQPERQAERQAEKRGDGRRKKGQKPPSRKGQRCSTDASGAGGTADSGQAERQAKRQSPTYIKEVINNNTPYPLLKKGGCDSSKILFGPEEEGINAVLNLWRIEREKAGLAFVLDRATKRGAKNLVRDYLSDAQLTVDQLRAGMAKIIRMIQTDSHCHKYTLDTMAKNPSTYCPPPPIEKIKRKMVSWLFECDVCGAEISTPFQSESAEIHPQPCIRAKHGCQGTMYPNLKRER